MTVCLSCFHLWFCTHHCRYSSWTSKSDDSPPNAASSLICSNARWPANNKSYTTRPITLIFLTSFRNQMYEKYLSDDGISGNQAQTRQCHLYRRVQSTLAQCLRQAAATCSFSDSENNIRLRFWRFTTSVIDRKITVQAAKRIKLHCCFVIHRSQSRYYKTAKPGRASKLSLVTAKLINGFTFVGFSLRYWCSVVTASCDSRRAAVVKPAIDEAITATALNGCLAIVAQ